MIFSKAKNKNVKPKGQSALGVLFNPGIGDTIRPLGETTAVFVNLLAMVFATQGLFPRNHPALNGVKDTPRLKLFGVMSTAWRSLSFTKDKIPQVILFFAVVGIMGFSCLALFIVLASMFVGKAHAQNTVPACQSAGFFSPCDPVNDIAVNWLGYLFNDKVMANYVTAYGGGSTGQIQPQSFVVQDALKTALGFYSDAIMVVAAVILFYHLVSMIVNTAHHGVVMGKQANQVWAPIRLVFAVGLLVPLAGGLNTGQYLVITVAQWGSNMAGHVWNTFVTQLAADATCTAGGNGSQMTGSGCGVPGIMPYARKAVYDTVMTQACVATYNSRINGTGGGTTAGSSGPPPIPGSLYGTYSSGNQSDPTCSPQPLNAPVGGNSGGAQGGGPQITPSYPAMVGTATTAADGSQTVGFNLQQGQLLSQKNICGYYKFPAPQPIDQSDAIQQAVLDATTTTGASAFNTMVTSVQSYVQTNLTSFIPSCLGGQEDALMTQNTGQLEEIVAQYQNDLQQGFASTAQTFAAQMQQVAATTSSQGWVSAGAWFNTIAREQSALMDISAAIPGTQGPTMKPIGDASNGMYDSYVLPTLMSFQQWVNATTYQPGTIQAGTGQDSQAQQMELAAAGFAQNASDKGGDVHYMDIIFAEIDYLASFNNMWHSAYTTAGGALSPATSITPGSFQLGVQFQGANPLAEIAAFGHNSIDVAYQLFDTYLTLTVLGSAAGGAGDAGAAVLGPIAPMLKGLGEGVNSIGSIFGLVSMVFFTIGFMLAYFLPMIPFFRFLFNVVTWIVALLEAIIAVPLFALAHLTPDGEGLAGSMARPGYFFILAIFLRPALMVFGLIIGLLIFYIATNYMNILFNLAIAGSGGISHHHITLAKFAYSILYVVMLYVLANTSFKAIGWLPDHAMSWLGQSGLQYDTDNLDKIEQVSSLAATMIESKISGAAAQAAGGAGKLIGGTATGVGGALAGGVGAGAGAAGALTLLAGAAQHGPQAVSQLAQAMKPGTPGGDAVAAITKVGGGIADRAHAAEDHALGVGAPPLVKPNPSGGNTEGQS